MRPKKTRAVARKEINWLISKFQKKGFVAIKTVGYYQGGHEQSLFVADPKNNGNLKETLIEYGKLFNQDTILFRPKGGKSRLIVTRGKKFGNETQDSHASSYGSSTSSNYSKVGGRTFSDTIDIDDDFWPESVSFANIVKNLLGESTLTRSIKNVMNESKDILTITTNDLYEWLMEIGSNSMLDEFKPHQIKAVIEMMLREGDELPQDDSQMAAWCRKNEDHIIETVARATGAYFMSKEEFAKKQEEEMPQVIVQGSEILYNKRGRACGLKVSVKDYGTLYMKRKGSHWEITDISQQNDDQRVWEMVKSSLEKMAKKNPTTFIRFMRNRAYELPKFKPTTITESVTLNDIDVTVQDIQKRMGDANNRIIAQWLDKNDGWDFNSFKDIITSIEDDTNPQQRFSNAVNEISGIVHGWLNLSENNVEITNIIRKNLKSWVKTHHNIPSTMKSIKAFVSSIWDEQLKPYKNL